MQVALVADNQHFLGCRGGGQGTHHLPIERGDIMLTKQAFIAGSDPYANFDYGMLKPVIRTDCIRRLALAYRETARLSEDFMYLTDFFAAGETGFPDRPTAVQLDPVVRHDLASVDTDGCGRLAL